MRPAGATARPSTVFPKSTSPAPTTCTLGCPHTSTAASLGLASSGEMSMAPPEKTSATTGPFAAAVTAATSASCASEMLITRRSWPSRSRDRSLPMASTTSGAVAAAAAAAATPEVSVELTLGGQVMAVAPATCCVMASSGAKLEPGQGVEP
jgi:hypothetical protein